MIVDRRSFLLGFAATAALSTATIAKVPKIVTPGLLDDRIGKRKIIDMVISAAQDIGDSGLAKDEMVLWTLGEPRKDPMFQICLNWRATFRWVPVPDVNWVIDPTRGFVVGNAPAFGHTYLTMITDDGFGKKYTEIFEWKNGLLVRQGFEPHPSNTA